MYNTVECQYSAIRINPKTNKIGYPVTITIKGIYNPKNQDKAIAMIDKILTSNPDIMIKSQGKTLKELGWGLTVRVLVFGQGARIIEQGKFQILIPIKE